MKFFFVVCLALATSLNFSADARIFIRESFFSTKNWIFLDKFAFYSQTGNVQFTITYLKKYKPQNLLLYYDGGNFWNSIYTSLMKCNEKSSYLNSKTSQIFQLVPEKELDEGKRHETGMNCTYVGKELESIRCFTPKIPFSTSRIMYWFFVLANCDSNDGVFANISMTFRNSFDDNVFLEHFSVDEIGIYEMTIVFFCLYFACFIAIIIYYVTLYKKDYLHTTFKMFSIVIILNTIAYLILMISWSTYGASGLRNLSLRYIGEIVLEISNILFLVIILLMSFGYSIIVGKLSQTILAIGTVFIVFYVLGVIAMYILEIVTFDPGLVQYRYDSPAGYGLIAIQFLTLIVFVCACMYTMKVQRKIKRIPKIYFVFLVFYSIWLVLVPTLSIIALSVMNNWIRLKVITGFNYSIHFYAHFIFLVFTFPSKMVNSIFIYITKPSVIEDLTAEDAIADPAVLEEKDFSPDANFFSLFEVPASQSRQAQPKPTVNTAVALSSLKEISDKNRETQLNNK